jgi:hypothetical protein
MKLTVAPQTRGMQRELPGLNLCSLYCNRDEDAGFADVAVVKEILGFGFKGIGVEEPSLPGNLHPELMLLIALPV